MLSNQQFHHIGLEPNIRQGADKQMILPDLGRFISIANTKANSLNCNKIFKPDSDKLNSCQQLKFLDEANKELIGAYKTPSVRNLAKTSPFFHDGRADNIMSVIEHYDQLHNKNLSLIHI